MIETPQIPRRKSNGRKPKRRIPKTFDQQRDEWLIWQFRRLHIIWGPKNKAIQAARVGRGFYLCKSCKKVKRGKEGELDHIIPVVDPNGINRMDFVIRRMFCDCTGYQWLCHFCHALKTAKENDQRRKVDNLEKCHQKTLSSPS